MTPAEPLHDQDAGGVSARPTEDEPTVDEQNRGAVAAEPNGPGDTSRPPSEAVVPIETHCDGCEHLSEPPDFRCQHGEARILEVVDCSHVRLRGCPVVNHGDRPD